MATEISDLTKEIVKHLQQYTEEVREGVKVAADTSTKNGVKEVKKRVKSAGLIDWGDYYKGWTRTKVDKGYVIHNRTDSFLTHLLENGHVNRDGSRYEGVKHLYPTEQIVIEDFETQVERVIKGE